MLEQLISTQLFAIVLVFCRIGAALMVLPGYSDMYVSARLRLLLAIAISYALTPLLQPQLPPQPVAASALVILIGSELLIGAFIGLLAKLGMASLELAGTIISFAGGLSNATVYNPSLATQETLPGSMIGLVAVALIFVTNMHYFMLEAVVGSYNVFVPGHLPPISDFSDALARMTVSSFAVGTEMASPFIVTGVLLNLSLALIGRVAPSLQIQNLAPAAQVVFGLLMLVFIFPAMMSFWMGSFESLLHGLLTPG
ncbi:MAG: flagellar biosynthetic protein FliR [Azospirillaceae bacterium]|nr:flagellar biosynthetic protein FliR [Azospirillaceae bacterium]